jgi:hypothetical protein
MSTIYDHNMSEQQLLEKRQELIQDPVPNLAYPKYIYGRYFVSQKEYEDAIHEWFDAL